MSTIFRTHDHEAAIAEANRRAIETGRSQRVTIQRPDIPIKGVEFHVSEVSGIKQRLEVIDEVTPGDFRHRAVSR